MTSTETGNVRPKLSRVQTDEPLFNFTTDINCLLVRNDSLDFVYEIFVRRSRGKDRWNVFSLIGTRRSVLGGGVGGGSFVLSECSKSYQRRHSFSFLQYSIRGATFWTRKILSYLSEWLSPLFLRVQDSPRRRLLVPPGFVRYTSEGTGDGESLPTGPLGWGKGYLGQGKVDGWNQRDVYLSRGGCVRCTRPGSEVRWVKSSDEGVTRQV